MASTDSYGYRSDTDRPAARWWFRPAIAVVVLVVVGLAVLRGYRVSPLSGGIWLSSAESEQLVLAFEHPRGMVYGTVHQLRESRQVAQWGFAGTRRDDDEVKLTWGDGSTFSGAIDPAGEQLRGWLLVPDGDSRDLVFRRASADEVPGLLAQPEMPYRLRPPAAGSGWEIAEPSAAGVDPRHLERTVRAVALGEAGLLHSLLVVRHGRLLLEEYFHGYSRQHLHKIRTSTQSVTSLLIGIARDQGHLDNLDEPVLTFFPDYVEAAEPGWQEVTLRHLLTMTAGVDWRRQEILEAHGTGPAFFRQVFARPVRHPPGGRWLNDAPDVGLLAGVFFRATGEQADAFAARHLFEPLAINEWNWQQDRSAGYPSLGGTLRLRSLDMARIGQLVLDRGRHGDRQVVPEDWLTESTRPLAAARGYGYLWSLADVVTDDGPVSVIFAAGLGSQFIYIVPALDLVVVTTGGNHINHKTHAIGEVLVQRLLPGVEQQP